MLKGGITSKKDEWKATEIAASSSLNLFFFHSCRFVPSIMHELPADSSAFSPGLIMSYLIVSDDLFPWRPPMLITSLENSAKINECIPPPPHQIPSPYPYLSSPSVPEPCFQTRGSHGESRLSLPSFLLYEFAETVVWSKPGYEIDARVWDMSNIFALSLQA